MLKPKDIKNPKLKKLYETAKRKAYAEQKLKILKGDSNDPSIRKMQAKILKKLVESLPDDK